MILGDFQYLDEADGSGDATPETEHAAIEAERGEFDYGDLNTGDGLLTDEQPGEEDVEPDDEGTKNEESAPKEPVEPTPESERIQYNDDTEETAGEVPEAGEEPDAVQSDDGPEFSQGVRDRASRQGWSYSDLQRLGSNTAAESALFNAEGQQRHQPAMQQQPVQQPQQQVQQPQQFQVDRSQLEDYGEQIPNALDAQAQHNFQREQAHQQQLDSLQGQLNQMAAFSQQQQELAAKQQSLDSINRFDDMVSKLPKEYESLLGVGPSLQLDRMTPASSRRETTFNVYDSFVAKGTFPGESHDQIFQHAVDSVCGNQTQSIARQQLQEQSARQRATAVSRPTSRKSDDGKSSIGQTLDFVTDWQKKYGGANSHVAAAPAVEF